MAYTSSSCSSSFFLLLLFLSIFSHHHLHPSLFAEAADPALITGLCKNTKEPPVCQACLKKMAPPTCHHWPRSTPPGELKDVLDDCAMNSSLAADELDGLIDLIDSKDYRSAIDYIPSQVNHLVDYCFNNFYMHPKLTMPKQLYDAAANSDRDLNTISAILSTLV
ncbi:hypothetical protein CK203_089285 [Vitis vinifera]|uniref:Pectinesterase inhibitor domain-containing protein n=1 Tax=Vitis vinifera TaxID=29760 RepID=A0A438BSV7_VITVI|nr:hypothetical protein CK203_089285 [Vitis vinifera]